MRTKEKVKTFGYDGDEEMPMNAIGTCQTHDWGSLKLYLSMSPVRDS